jgi:hypothetical protein
MAVSPVPHCPRRYFRHIALARPDDLIRLDAEMQAKEEAYFASRPDRWCAARVTDPDLDVSTEEEA